MIEVRTEKRVAVDSQDHISPWGTAQDNSTNHRFNEKVFKLLGQKRIRVLDLGCSGGGFVRSMLDDGHDAIGIEGSDYSARTRRAEWRTIPERLFTADVSEPFEVMEDGSPLTFDLITAWELLEHLQEDKLPVLCASVIKHLRQNGLFIASICTSPDQDWHPTVRPRDWWLDLFNRYHLQQQQEIVDWFSGQFVRGPRFGWASASFHVALTKSGKAPPPLPRTSLGERMFDAWHFSRPHRILRELIVGRK